QRREGACLLTPSRRVRVSQGAEHQPNTQKLFLSFRYGRNRMEELPRSFLCRYARASSHVLVAFLSAPLWQGEASHNCKTASFDQRQCSEVWTKWDRVTSAASKLRPAVAERLHGAAEECAKLLCSERSLRRLDEIR